MLNGGASLLNLPNAVGTALCLWLATGSSAPDALLSAAVALPILSVVATAIWPNVSMTDTDDWFVDFNLFGAWLLPCMALGITFFDRYLIDTVEAWMSATALGCVVTGFVVLIEGRRRRISWLSGSVALTGFIAWGLGVVSFANAGLDRDEGQWMRATVVANSPTVAGHMSVRRYGARLTVQNAAGDVRRYELRSRDRWPVGAAICIVHKAGAFGWRYEELRDCDPNSVRPGIEAFFVGTAMAALPPSDLPIA
jgi:hypothetical protein